MYSSHCFSRENVYARVRVNGKMQKVLCDTGSLKCLIPADVVEGLKLGSCNVQLYSASAQPINVLGSVTLPIVIAGVKLSVNFIVSDEIGDIILGYEFMRDNGCEWAIGRSEMKIKGRVVRMIKRESGGACVRRVYVRDTISVPANSSRFIAVRMPYSRAFAHGADLNLPPIKTVQDTSWLLESTPLQKEKVFTAHSLLPEDDRGAVVSVLNLSDRSYQLQQDRLLGFAGEAVCLGTLMENISLKGKRDDVADMVCTVSHEEKKTVEKKKSTEQGSVTDNPLMRDSVRDVLNEHEKPSSMSQRCGMHDTCHQLCPCSGYCGTLEEMPHICALCGCIMLDDGIVVSGSAEPHSVRSGSSERLHDADLCCTRSCTNEDREGSIENKKSCLRPNQEIRQQQCYSADVLLNPVCLTDNGNVEYMRTM